MPSNRKFKPTSPAGGVVAKEYEPYVVEIDANGNRTVISGSAEETLLRWFDQFEREYILGQVAAERLKQRPAIPIERPTPPPVDRVEPVAAEPPIGVVLTAEDLAAILKCSPDSIAGMIDVGHIPQPHRLGGLQRWLRSEVDAWVAGGMKPIGRKRAKRFKRPRRRAR
jgi:predicted DNA-binding transcriptional regulator AlpA